MDETRDVAALSRAANLDLSRERLEIVGQILGEWRPGCLELNRKMSELARRDVVPITVLVHSGLEGAGT